MIHLITTVDFHRLAFLDQFVHHYRNAGVERFHVTLHTPRDLADEVGESLLVRARKRAETLRIAPPTSLVCDYDAMVLREHHDSIQARCSVTDWIVWADIDEFHAFPEPLDSLIPRWTADGSSIVRGRMIDRVASDGSLPPFDPDRSIFEQYPRRARVTELLVRGDVNKVVCSRADIRIRFGNHGPVEGQLVNWARDEVLVDHFKWDAGVVGRLQPRLTKEWAARCWWWTESRRVVDHINTNGGRLDIEAIEALAHLEGTT